MIPIKIGNQKYKIKAIHELTTAEFIELSKIDNIDMLKYISWQTGLSEEKTFFAVVSNTVEKAIGVIPDIKEMPKSKKFDYKKIIETVGQRHQIEKCKFEGYELLVFVLAVSQAASNNIDKVEELRAQYLDMPFTEILPSAFFFFKILQGGKRKEMKLLNWLRCSIKILNLRKPQGLKG